ncbi:MAG: deoxyribose-phosphate aldolase [Thermoprotei archaeon]|nr:MAG: deoxyribose-phosphate aldolase [Thermoprotei archaeon]
MYATLGELIQSIAGLRPEDFAKKIDHTILKPDATYSDVKRVCDEAIKYGFAACVVPPCWLKIASRILEGSGVKACTVVAFPLGFEDTDVKIQMVKKALENGAEEIDVVMNVSEFKTKRYDSVFSEISKLSEIVHRNGALIKVIIETALLGEEEIIKAAQLVADAGADFVKTNTGILGKVRPHDVFIIRKAVGDKVKIKAAGGIRNFVDAAILIALGADRLGSSSGDKIFEEYMYFRRKNK